MVGSEDTGNTNGLVGRGEYLGFCFSKSSVRMLTCCLYKFLTLVLMTYFLLNALSWNEFCPFFFGDSFFFVIFAIVTVRK